MGQQPGSADQSAFASVAQRRQSLYAVAPACTLSYQPPALLLAALSSCSEPQRKPIEEALRSLTVRSLLAAASGAMRAPEPPPQAGSLLGLLMLRGRGAVLLNFGGRGVTKAQLRLQGGDSGLEREGLQSR